MSGIAIDSTTDLQCADTAPAKKQKKGGKAAKQQASALTELRSAQQSAKVDAVWAALRGGRSGGGEQIAQTGASTAPGAASGDAAAAGGNSGAAAVAGITTDGLGQSSGGVKGPLVRKPEFSVASLCREVKKPDKRGDDTVSNHHLFSTTKFIAVLIKTETMCLMAILVFPLALHQKRCNLAIFNVLIVLPAALCDR